MTETELIRGNVMTVRATFIDDASGLPVDPDTVSAEVLTPDESSTVYTFALNPDVLVHDGAGVFHIDVSCPLSGYYRVRIFSTGAHEAAYVSQWKVLADPFTT